MSVAVPTHELDPAGLVADRRGSREVPAVAVLHAADAVLDLERLAGADVRKEGSEVVRVDDAAPRCGAGFDRSHAGVLEPAGVEVRRIAVHVGAPYDLRHRVGELLVPRRARALELAQLLLVQLLRLRAQPAVLLPQLDEDGDLRPEDVRVDRLEDVVDGSDRVAPEDALVVLRERGHEDDRHMLRARALLDQPRRLVAVQLRHVDVEENAREVVAEELAQGGDAGGSAHEPVAERREDGLEGEEVVLPVVDEEDVGRRDHATLR